MTQVEQDNELESRDQKADEIIKKSMTYAMAGGSIPIPVVDLTAVTAVQLDMLKQLARAYAIEFDPKSSKAFLISVSSALGGNLVARMGASLVKSVPVVGWLAGGAAQVVLTGASTYAVGKVVQKSMRNKTNLADIDLSVIKTEYEELFQTGKEMASKLAETLKQQKGSATTVNEDGVDDVDLDDVDVNPNPVDEEE